MTTYFSGAETRKRLLGAAAEVFSEDGFRLARAQEIAKRASATPAAVNYHFGDKEQLYYAVIDQALEMDSPKLPHQGLDPAISPEERLYAFIRSFLEHTLGSAHPLGITRLMVKELYEPSGALDRLIEKVVRPITDFLEGLVIELLGEDAEPDLVHQSAGSIISQCVIYSYSREIFLRTGDITSFDEATLDRIAAHIARFSLAALRGLKKGIPA
jgi:AcrR family transcriptional regulator